MIAGLYRGDLFSYVFVINLDMAYQFIFGAGWSASQDGAGLAQGVNHIAKIQRVLRSPNAAF